MTFRPFESKDASAVSKIVIDDLRTFYGGGFDLEEYCQKFTPNGVLEQAKSQEIVIAEESDEVVGLVGIEKNEVKSLFVKIGNQKKGLGTKLLKLAEDKILLVGFKTIRVLSGQHSIKFYEKMGYINTGNIFANGEETEMVKEVEESKK